MTASRSPGDILPNVEVVVSVERLTLAVDDPAVTWSTAALHPRTRVTRRKGRSRTRVTRRKGRSVLLAPGAGGDLDGPGLTALAETLAHVGCTVVRANLPYREAGRRAPRADRSVPGYRSVLAAAREAVGDARPWVIGGKSYGGRVASMVLAGGDPAAGLLCYGYPLHPPGKPDRLRVEHWPEVYTPTLFLQGDRDPFCDLHLLKAHMRKLPRRATLRVVEGGDHSLRVSQAASPTGEASSEAETIAGLRDELRRWLGSLEG